MDKDIITSINQKIEEAKRKADPKHPEHQEVWVERLERLLAWKRRSEKLLALESRNEAA